MPKRARRVSRRTQKKVENAIQLLELAAASLGFTEAEMRAAQEPGELSDMLEARVFEMLALMHGAPDARARAELEQRNGAGFIDRVSAMGTPAAAALSSHKIHFGELLARPSAVLDNVRKWRNGGLLQRCTAGALRHVRAGQRRAPASWRARASASRSSFGSRERRSTPARSRVPGSPSTPSDAPAEPWSVPRVADPFVPSWLL